MVRVYEPNKYFCMRNRERTEHSTIRFVWGGIGHPGRSELGGRRKIQGEINSKSVKTAINRAMDATV